eukprot:g49216.t1
MAVGDYKGPFTLQGMSTMIITLVLSAWLGVAQQANLLDDGSSSWDPNAEYFYDCRVEEWQGFEDGTNVTVCGMCKAMVPTKDYPTCRQYCAAQEHGLTCKAAYEDLQNDCNTTQEKELGCDFNFVEELKTTDMICECESQEVEHDRCGTKHWDKDEKGHSSIKRSCGSCKVLTASVDMYYSCNYFCAYQSYKGLSGHACVGAWEDFDGRCGTIAEYNCATDFRALNTTDMICECSETEEAKWAELFVVTPSNRRSTWEKAGVASLIVGLLLLGLALIYVTYWQIKKCRDIERKSLNSENPSSDDSRKGHRAALREPLTPTKQPPAEAEAQGGPVETGGQVGQTTPSKKQALHGSSPQMAAVVEEGKAGSSMETEMSEQTPARSRRGMQRVTPRTAGSGRKSTAKKSKRHGPGSPYAAVRDDEPQGMEGEVEEDDESEEEAPSVPDDL